MSGDNVARSLALSISNRSVGTYKKLSSETFVNLRLLRFTHVESEFERGECNCEIKTRLQMKETLLPKWGYTKRCMCYYSTS